MQRQVDQGIVTQDARDLKPASRIGHETPPHDLDVVRNGEGFGLVGNLCPFSVGVRQSSTLAEPSRQVSVVCAPSINQM